MRRHRRIGAATPGTKREICASQTVTLSGWTGGRGTDGCEITGLELEAQAQLLPDLNVSASYAYTFTKIPATINPFNNCSNTWLSIQARASVPR